MSKKDPYRKEVRWHFRAGGECWAIFTINHDRKIVEIEETRKNGQEDCHVSGELRLTDGKWLWDPDGAEYGIDLYFGEKTRFAVEAYLNKHGIPEEGSPNE